MEKYMLPCPIKEYFGFECLGCGFQRSLFLLFQGEFVRAFYMYPAIYPLLFLGGLVMLNKISPIPYERKIIFVAGIVSVASIIAAYGFKHFL